MIHSDMKSARRIGKAFVGTVILTVGLLMMSEFVRSAFIGVTLGYLGMKLMAAGFRD